MWRHGWKGSEDKSALWSCLTKTVDAGCSEAVFNDHAAVSEMAFLRTDVGKARAWIRLCIEKKVLSKHLEEIMRWVSA